MPDGEDESGIHGEALVGRERRGAAQREDRIRRSGGPQVEVAVALQHADAVAGRVAAQKDRAAVGELGVRDLERTAAVAAYTAARGEQAARGGERLLVAGGADGEDQRLRILRDGEERDPFVRIEAVGIRRLGVKHVEADGVADAPRDLVEDGAQRQLGGHFPVGGDPRPGRGQKEGGADVGGDGHRDGALEHRHMGARRAALPVLVAHGLDDRVDACARERVHHRRALRGGGPVSEVPDDLRPLGQLLRLAEPEPDTRVGRPRIARIGVDPLRARQQDEQATDQGRSHARRVYHTPSGRCGASSRGAG